MPEFLLAEQLANKLNVTNLSEFEENGILKAVTKNGRTYYSSRDFYRLKAVLHFVREQGLSVDEAQNRLDNWNWAPQSAAVGAR